ncbi:MAG TPA: GatB/YqeY domain-containing protein [bacterium]|nr:GatB/YqeY domain-containing protein [bacterium]
MLDVDAAIRKALKEKDHPALVGYRALKAKVNIKLTEAGRGADKPLTEAELLALIQREVKERQESNEFLTPDRADYQENARIIEVLQAHLPKALSAEETEAAVRKAIADSGAAGPKDMGKVMAALRQVQGVDMSTASARVKALLQAGG